MDFLGSVQNTFQINTLDRKGRTPLDVSVLQSSSILMYIVQMTIESQEANKCQNAAVIAILKKNSALSGSDTELETSRKVGL